MKKGLISIVIPTLNASSHLKILMPSLKKQTYKNFEVIINDDKRTSDNTKELIYQFKKNLRIKYIQKNISMAQGRKSGSEFARGEYLLHLDADMRLSNGVLEDCVREIRRDYSALVVPEISYGKGYWAKVKSFERSMYIGDEDMESARFFKSSIYRKLGGHNEKMVLSEDKDLDLRVRMAGLKVGRINEPIYHNEGNLGLKKDLKKKFFYGKTAHIFITEHPKHAFVQANLIFRPAYFRNWRKLINNPRLSAGMFLMKTLETFAAFMGLIVERIR